MYFLVLSWGWESEKRRKERRRKEKEKERERERKIEEKNVKDEKGEESGKDEKKGRKANVPLFCGSVCLLIFDFQIHSIFLLDHVLPNNLYNFPKVKTSS